MPYQSRHRAVAQKATPCAKSTLRPVSTSKSAAPRVGGVRRPSILTFLARGDNHPGGLPLDFTALRYFGGAGQARSVRSAAERRHLSSSAVSRQVAKLELEQPVTKCV